MRRSFFSPAIFCRFSFRASRYLGDKWNQAMVPKQKSFESKSSFQNLKKKTKKQLKVGFPFLPATQIFWKRNYNYIKIENRLPRLMILKEVCKNKIRLGSILTYHLCIYFCKSVSEFAHHFNLQVISGACPYFKTTTFWFYFTEIKRFKQCKNVHQQMATKLSQQIWLPSLPRSWATRADASQPGQFRLGDDQIFSYKNPIKWSGFCLTFNWLVCVSPNLGERWTFLRCEF